MQSPNPFAATLTGTATYIRIHTSVTLKVGDCRNMWWLQCEYVVAQLVYAATHNFNSHHLFLLPRTRLCLLGIELSCFIAFLLAIKLR